MATQLRHRSPHPTNEQPIVEQKKESNEPKVNKTQEDFPPSWANFRKQLKHASLMYNPYPGKGFGRYCQEEWPPHVRIYKSSNGTFKVFLERKEEFQIWEKWVNNGAATFWAESLLFSLSKLVIG